MVKLAQKGHSVIKMYGGQGLNQSSSESILPPTTPPRDSEPSKSENSGRVSPGNTPSAKGIHLFADSSVATCFFRYIFFPHECIILSFRRLAFSPDGSLLVAPTGVYRPTSKSTNQIFATHIFHRSDFSTPIVTLAGLESPSVAVRFSPVLYEIVPETSPPLFQGDYR